MAWRSAPRSALLVFILLTASSAAADPPPAPQNGDVLIGSPVHGGRLDRSEAPDRPLLVTIDTPYEVFDAAGSLVHVAAWTTEGRPADGARVYLADELVGRTDEQGVLVFRWGVSGSEVDEYWTSGSRVSVRWEHRGRLYGGSVWFSALARTQSFASDHLFVYTDRGVYDPGDTIHLRLIGWHLEADWSPVVGGEVEVLLLDPSGRVVGGTGLVTDDLGVASADLGLPAHAEEGPYRLVARYEDAEAEADLRVEAFLTPEIRIDHDVGRFLTADQTELAFEVALSTFTGAGFEAGSVTVELIAPTGDTLYRLERDVEGPGPHRFRIGGGDLDAVREPLWDRDRLQVRIAVEDSLGRRDEVRRDMTFRSNPYIAIIERDRDAYSTGDAVELIVRLTDVERVPVRGRELTLTTSTGRTLTAATDEGGTAQFSLEMGDGAFDVAVTLPEVSEPLATSWIEWQEPQPMRSHIADAIVSEGQTTPIRVTFPSHFKPAESVVHVDVVDSSGSLVNAVLVPIRETGGAFVAEGAFVAPSWGSMLLTLFCLGRDDTASGETGRFETDLGLLTEGQNLVVHPDRELSIHLDGIPDEVPPGTDFWASIRVTDSRGDPVEAAVGVALVDLAAISLKDPLEITPMDHFYNPELRVISTTGAAILTWPVVSRNWGESTRDVALPPFPFRPGGEIVREAVRRDMAVLGSGEGEAGAVEGLGVTGYGMGGGGSASGYGVIYGSPSVSLGSPVPELVAGDPARPPAETLAPAPVITIRTEFPETSFWAPSLRAVGGSVDVTAHLPDAITIQELAVVASDAGGGVGLLRVPIRVTQPLFVRTDLPDTLTLGERAEARVTVRNLTDEEVDARVATSSDTLRIYGGPRLVTLPVGGTAVVEFEVEADTAGRQTYEVLARTATGFDGEAREILVRPFGLPEVSVTTGIASAAARFATEVEIPDDAQLTTVAMSVRFPAVSSGFADLGAARDELAKGDLMSLGGDLIATALLYRYRLERGATVAELEPIRAALSTALSDVVGAQCADGGWGFFWDAESNPWATGYCLEALTALDEIGLSPPAETLESAVDYLARALAGNTWDVSAIDFWEGGSDLVRLGVTAEIFDVLTGLPAAARTGAWAALVDRLAERFDALLDEGSQDVLAAAHAVLGLRRLSELGRFEIDPSRLADAAARLTDLRREAHWEPSWFSAYGGTIEATTTALEVLQALDVEMTDAETREAVRYLLSTRDEWGGWHNPRGTAAAIRALLILDPPEPEVASTVRVLVDGVEVRRVAIDPADPFLSAAELRALELTDHLAPGSHAIAVDYDGRLEPDVRVTVRIWPSLREKS